MTLILLVIAAICFALAAFNANVPKVNLIAVGLLALTLTQLLPALHL